MECARKPGESDARPGGLGGSSHRRATRPACERARGGRTRRVLGTRIRGAGARRGHRGEGPGIRGGKNLLGGAEVRDAAAVDRHGAVHEGPEGRARLECRGRRRGGRDVGDERLEHGTGALAHA